MRGLKSYSQNLTIITIIVCSIFFWIVRVPSLFEPYYYGDEMIYLSIGNGLRQGLSLYSDLYDNKTPLLYIVAAITENLFTFRLVAGIFMFAAIFFIFGIVRQVTRSGSKMPIYSMIVSTAMFSLPIFEVFIANAENYFILPTSAAIYFLTRFMSSQKNKYLLFTGLLLGVAVLFKVPTIADFFAAIGILFVLTKLNPKGITKLIVQSLIVFSGLATPIMLSILWFAVNNNLSDFLSFAILGNLGYSTSWSGEGSTTIQLILLSLIFASTVLVLSVIRKSGKVTDLFIISVVWLLGSLTGALLSSRPYPHYLIQTLPALSILLTILFFSSKKQQVYTVFVITIYLFFISKVDFWLYDLKAYKERVVGLISYGNQSEDYLNLFGEDVAENHEVAAIIKEETVVGQSVFVWGDSAPIYAMSKRLPPTKYTAYYHVDEFLSEEQVCSIIKSDGTPLLIIDTRRQTDCLDSVTGRYYKLTQNTKNYKFWLLEAKE